jgi:hypothetical protein
MKTAITYFLEYAELEFDGRAFNGDSLMKTFDGLSAEGAASKRTFEGYSAWDIAVHALYYKYLYAKLLGKAGGLEPFPYAMGNDGFAPQPAEVSEEAWRGTLLYMRRTHEVCMAALATLRESDLETTMSEWNIPWGRAIAWLCTHDAYHSAQIRNMGVPGLRSPRRGEGEA